MVHSKWPQLDVSSIRPVDNAMEHHGSCPGSDRAYGAFSYTGLVVCADSRERLCGLEVASNKLLEFSGSEWGVVGVNALELDAVIERILLYGAQGLYGLTCGQGHLVAQEHFARGCVDSDQAAIVLR